jgi:hypothetical protein
LYNNILQLRYAFELRCLVDCELHLFESRFVTLTPRPELLGLESPAQSLESIVLTVILEINSRQRRLASHRKFGTAPTAAAAAAAAVAAAAVPHPCVSKQEVKQQRNFHFSRYWLSFG